MSRYKVIKIMLLSNVILFLHILWCTIANGFGGMNPGYKDFIFVFSIMLLMQLMEMKNIKPYIIIISMIVLNFGVFYLFYGKEDFIPYSIYGLMAILVLPRVDMENIIYNYFLRVIRNLLIGSLILLPIYLKVETIYLAGLFKFYILFFSLSILTLREARKFDYSIKSKKSVQFNIAILASILLLSTDFIFNIVKRILEVVFHWLSYILGWFFFLVFSLLFEIFKGIYKLLTHVKLKAPSRIESFESSKELYEAIKEGKDFLPLEIGIKVLLFILIIYLIYGTIRKYRYRNILKKSGIEEVREKISKNERIIQGRKNLVDKIKEIFRAKNNRERILNIYRDFEIKTDKKGIFKRYMTAKQLYNMTKSEVGYGEELKNLTHTYNEAKFSDHPIEDERVDKFKSDYGKIKRRLWNTAKFCRIFYVGCGIIIMFLIIKILQ